MVYICRLAFDNIKDIIAVGFDPKKTFIFTDLDYIQVLCNNNVFFHFIIISFSSFHYLFFSSFIIPPKHMYPTILKIQKATTYNQVWVTVAYIFSTVITITAHFTSIMVPGASDFRLYNVR